MPENKGQSNPEDGRYRRILQKNPRIDRVVGQMPVPRNTLERTSAQVLAPALGGWVEWLLWQAMRRGIRRLYFLARDGYFAYRAARRYCERLGLPLDCRYISCSRYSLRLPLFHQNPEAALDYVCRGGMHVTPDTILRRAGLTREEREGILLQLHLPYSRDEVIPYAELAGLRLRLSRCDAFIHSMLRHSQEAFPALAGYLEQEGMLERVPDAVVDSGWVGSIQQTLNEILSRLGRRKTLSGFYWGLYDLPREVSASDYHWYYFGPGHRLCDKVYFNNCLFEAVYTAPHGMTLYYEQSDRGYRPCYGRIAPQKRNVVLELEDVFQNYIRLLSEDAAPRGICREIIERDRKTIGKLMKQWMASPSREEAEFFGSLPFSDDVLEGEEQPLAAVLTQDELKANHAVHKLLVMAGKRTDILRESAWYEGSAVRSGERVKSHLRQHALYQGLRYLRKDWQYRQKRRG